MNLHHIPLLLRDCFEQSPDVLNGKLRIRETRVSVEQVLELLDAGLEPAEIIRSFPSLTKENVAAVERLAFHFALTALQAAG